MAASCSLEGELRLAESFPLQAGILGEVSGEGCSKVFISSPGVPFKGLSNHCSWFWHRPPGYAAFLDLKLKHHRGLDVISKEVVTFCIWL